MNNSRRVALVTGAARRLGRTVALALAGSGYDTAIHYRNSETEASELAEKIVSDRGKGSAETFRADLADPQACEILVKEVIAKFGRIDVLVNNASIFSKTPVASVSHLDIEELHSIHVAAPAILSLSAAGSLKGGMPGRIINILDIFARYPRKGFLPYTISKAGLESLTRQLAVEFAPDILVNGVAPGAILDPDGGMDEATRRAIIKRIPLKRFGAAKDIADAVLFLSKSGYITGQTIIVDGGRSLNI